MYLHILVISGCHSHTDIGCLSSMYSSRFCTWTLAQKQRHNTVGTYRTTPLSSLWGSSRAFSVMTESQKLRCPRQSKAKHIKSCCQEEWDFLGVALCAVLLPLVSVACWAGRHSWLLLSCKDGYIQEFAPWKLGHLIRAISMSLLELWLTDGTWPCVLVSDTTYQMPTNSKNWKHDYSSKTMYSILIDWCLWICVLIFTLGDQ